MQNNIKKCNYIILYYFILIPLKSMIFNCLLLVPTTIHFCSFLNQAMECTVSETPTSVIGLTESVCTVL